MEENTGLLDGLNNAINYLAEPSIIHWLSLWYGDWVLGVFNDSVAINYPVSALMITLASLNIVALAALLIVLAFTGGKSLLAGLVTADIASGNSKFLPLRLLIAFSLLMPTSAGIEAMKDYNVSISNVQLNTMRVIVGGGAIADWLWMQSTRALFQFNIGGASPIRNTIERSNSFARAFTCNYLYHKTIGASNGEQLFYYLSGRENVPSFDSLQGADSLSDITLPNEGALPSFLRIRLGGPNESCGTLTFQLQGDPKVEGDQKANMFSGTNDLVAEMQYLMRREANTVLLSTMQPYAEFAQRYYDAFSTVSVKTLYESKKVEVAGEPFAPEAVNVGSLQSSVSTIKDKVNASGDALIYLTQQLAYNQQSISQRSLSVFGEHFGTSENGGKVPETSISDRIFNSYLSGYISAGAFWSFYQDFSALAYDAERYANGFSVTLSNMNDGGELCKGSLFSWFSSSSVDGIEFACETTGHLTIGFDWVIEVSKQKAAMKQMANTISTPDRDYEVDVALWSGFYSIGQGETSTGLGVWSSIVVWLIEMVWKGMEWANLNGSSGSLIGSHEQDRLSLLSGDDNLLFNLTGQNSPYIFLTQVGEGMRDISFLMHLINGSIQAYVDTGLSVAKNTSNSVTQTVPFVSAPIAFAIELPFQMMRNIWGWFGQGLKTLVSVLSTTSLILVYGLPSIPVIGWTMVLAGLFFTFFAAMAAVPFAAVLLGIPKGEGLFAPDTERVLSLVYGIFIRQPLTVVGFIGSMYMGYTSMSLFNLIWFTTFFSKLDGLGLLDSTLAIIFIFLGYGVGLFFIALYSFRITTMTVDTVGLWFSSVLVGGAFGNNENEIQSSTQAIQNLSSKLDEFASAKEQSPSGSQSNSNPNGRSQSGMNA
ncbi:hypothetical protein ACTFQF_00075 [Aliivibrio fischeri]|uniref:Membrane protein, putative n=1 Tax=Aliivibrio fischeri (strain MJ11) TaxID=388396 RepID=B5EW48_ALIFM|nr:hypothetical protein [Aliivibrio fischeri]ACH64709.1 membrane protein, putative [Aliivibrio fischeri MJ11]MUK37626.1 hypothetical protein [Aliivibrio fischeri]